MATQSIRNFQQLTGRNMTGLAANTARAPRMQTPSPAPMMPPMMGPPAPAAQPGGRLVPGRSGGSMVWQPNTPAPAATPTPAPAPMPMPTDTTPAPSFGSNGFGSSPLEGDMGLGRPLGAPAPTPAPTPAPAPSFGSNSFGSSPLEGDMGLGRPLGAPAPTPAPAPSFGSNSFGSSPLDGDMGLGKPLEFGGAFANGGIAPAGKVSLVGERGPEMIVPMGPTAVIPMRAAPTVTPNYSLNAPPRAVGRSMSDPQRMNEIAMRRMRSQGDYQGAARLATNQQWLDARFGGRNAAMPAPAIMLGAMPQPAPPQPGGRLVPGRSAGSMVWQPDAPPPMAPAPDILPTPMASPMRPPEQPAADAMPMPAPDLTINPLTGLPFALATPNVPSGFMAQQAQAQNATFPGLPPAPPGLYTEAPPPVDSIQIPNTGMMVPVFNGKVSPQPLPMVKPEAPLPPGMVPTEANRGGITYRAPGVPETPRAPQVRRILIGNQEVDAQWNAQTNQWEPVAMAGGSATPAAAGGNVPPSPTTGKTASGISFTLK